MRFTRVLVTGASGGIGRQLVYELLKQGYHPIAMVREGSDTSYLDLVSIERRVADIRNEQQIERAVEGIEAIIHAAALVDFRQDRMTQFAGVNTLGAINVFRAAKNAGVKRFIHVSSVAAVGGIPRNKKSGSVVPMTESHEFNLDHLRIPYIASKHAAELELMKLTDNGGPELVIVNPSIVVAPSRSGDDRGKALRRFRFGFLPRLKNYLNLVDIRDVVPAIVSALEKGKSGERYILAGENINAIELAGMVSDLLNIKPVLLPIPRIALDTAARCTVAWNRFTGHGKQSFYPDLVKMLDYDWAWDSTKAQTELEFSPRPLKQTLTDILTNDFNGTWMKP